MLERGEQLAKRKQLYEALYPETRRGAAGGHGKARGATEIISFADATGRANHLSPRTIQHEVQIAQNIPASTRKKLKGTRVENRKVDLMKIARLPHAEQEEVAELLATGEAPSLGAALSILATAKIEEHDDALPKGPFSVLVVDPPWPHDENKRPYPCMTLDEIMALDVPGISANSAVCLLWVPPTVLKQGVDVLAHWGFRQVGFVTWVKTNARPGYYVMQQAELCLLGIRGQPTVKKALPNIIKAPVRQHSRKPDEFYQWAASSFAGSRVDLFSRESRKGWKTWGAEKRKFDPRESSP